MEKQTSWKATAEGVLQSPKFLRKGTHVTVKPTEPIETEVEGQWGIRKVYVIDTVEFGLIYVSPLQIVKIAHCLSIKDYKSSVGVDL